MNNKVNLLLLIRVALFLLKCIDYYPCLPLFRRKYHLYKHLWERKLKGLSEDEQSSVRNNIQVYTLRVLHLSSNLL